MVALNVVVVENNTQKLTAGTTVTTANFNTTSGTAKLRQVRFYAPNTNTADVFVAFYNATSSPAPTIPTTIPGSAPFWMPVAAGEIEVFDMGQFDTIACGTVAASGQIVYATLCEGAARN